MAQHLKLGQSEKGWPSSVVLHLIPVIITLVWAVSSKAETLLDPTRPPGTTNLAVDGKPEAVATGPVLQTVMMSAKRKVAVISGQVVALGEKYGDATLIRLTDREVVLRNSDKTLRTLKLHPEVEKKAVLQKLTGNTGNSASKGSRRESTR